MIEMMTTSKLMIKKMMLIYKKVSKGNIYVKNTAEETAVSNDILKVQTFCQKPFVVLDIITKNIPFQAAKRSTGHGHGQAVQAVLYEDCISLSFLTTFTFFITFLTIALATDIKIFQLPNGLLDMDKPFKLFDMKKFQQNVNREMKRQFPERNKLETQVRNFDLVSL